MNGRPSTLVVAVLCVLAGCNGFVGQEDPAVERTITPAPVPTVADEPAQGISEHRINAPAVSSNHQDALRDEPYTIRTRIRWRDENGSTYGHTTVHRVEPGGQRFHVVAEYSRPRGSDNLTGHELWYDGNRTILRVEDADGNEEFRRVDTDAVDQYPRARLINALFARLEPGSVEQTDDGDTVVSGPIEGVDDLQGLSQFRNETDASMSARITPDGYVARIAIGYEATEQGQPVDVRVTMDVTDVGSTSVSKPAWAENVRGRLETPTPSE